MPRLPHHVGRPLSRATYPGLFALVCSGLLAASVAGCGSKESIERYRVPKPELVYAANHVDRSSAPVAGPADMARPTHRMLGAVVPNGAQTWYFKMTGPVAAVASQESAFRQLIASLRFADEQAPPQWSLPPAWKETAGSGSRTATLTVDVEGQTLEVSVIPLASAPSASSLLDNINRWRRQMQLPPITDAQLADQTTTIDLAGGQATLVNLVGQFAGGEMGSTTLGQGDRRPAEPPAGQAP